MKTLTTSERIFSQICFVPCQSMSNIMSWPLASACSTGFRGVP